MEHGAYKPVKNPLLEGFPEPKPDNYKSYIKNKKAVCNIWFKRSAQLTTAHFCQGIGKVAAAVKGGASATKIKSMLDNGK